MFRGWLGAGESDFLQLTWTTCSILGERTPACSTPASFELPLASFDASASRFGYTNSENSEKFGGRACENVERCMRRAAGRYDNMFSFAAKH